jgi:GntR family transcriptional regulator, transcriptional repressor for pyruvate dehydrogenase complex
MATQRVLRRSKLSEQLAGHLTDLIVDGTLAPSESLPPERELAKQYIVSVGVVREAIRSLSAIGLLDVRHGVGSIVNPRELWNTSAPMLLLIQSEPNSVLAVHDVRSPLEVVSAETAATMAGPPDVQVLDDALGRMTANMDDLEANVAADLDFHLALARATHNRILLSVLQSLIEPIHECMLRGTHVRTAARLAITFHRAIADAVRAHSPHQARQAMLQHMEITREELMSLVDSGIDLVTPSERADGRTKSQVARQAASRKSQVTSHKNSAQASLDSRNSRLTVRDSNLLTND